MGGLCSGNIFNELHQKHKDQFVKLMVVQNSKDIVQGQFETLYNNSDTMFNNVQHQITQKYDQKNVELVTKYALIRSKIDSIPGGVNGLQASQRRSLDDISGFNEIKAKTSGTKQESLLGIQNQRVHYREKMKVSYDNYLSRLQNQERPVIERYNNLPQPTQRDVKEQSKILFKDQIQARRTQIHNQIQRQFNLRQIQANLLAKYNPDAGMQKVYASHKGYFSPNSATIQQIRALQRNPRTNTAQYLIIYNTKEMKIAGQNEISAICPFQFAMYLDSKKQK